MKDYLSSPVVDNLVKCIEELMILDPMLMSQSQRHRDLWKGFIQPSIFEAKKYKKQSLNLENYRFMLKLLASYVEYFTDQISHLEELKQRIESNRVQEILKELFPGAELIELGGISDITENIERLSAEVKVAGDLHSKISTIIINAEILGMTDAKIA